MIVGSMGNNIGIHMSQRSVVKGCSRNMNDTHLKMKIYFTITLEFYREIKHDVKLLQDCLSVSVLHTPPS